MALFNISQTIVVIYLVMSRIDSGIYVYWRMGNGRIIGCPYSNKPEEHILVTHTLYTA